MKILSNFVMKTWVNSCHFLEKVSIRTNKRVIGLNLIKHYNQIKKVYIVA